jgi:5'-nucleotidase
MMRILITNDDGIHAPGLGVCEEIARTLSDDIWVVAPESDQSGVSHSLSLNDPLRLRKVGERHFAVKGTPTDCVIMGVRNILETPPDLVLSGVNRGQNVAEDVSYSGTVAGAIEGTVLGITSIAMSQAYGLETRQNPTWATALRYGPDIIRRALHTGVPRDVLININFPDCPPEQVVGIAVASQGKRDQDLLRIEARHDGRGNPYYWIAFSRRERPKPRDEPFMTKLADTFAAAKV